MNHDDQEEQSVSFQELKKRWAQQESVAHQQTVMCPSKSSSTNNVEPPDGNEDAVSASSPIITPTSSLRSVPSSSKQTGALLPKPASMSKTEPSPPLPPVPLVSSPPPLVLSPPNNALTSRINTNTNVEFLETVTAKIPPSIPPKPSTSSSSSQQPKHQDTGGISLSTASTPLAKGVSLLAQQFDNKSVARSTVAAPALIPTTQDPFLDDEVSDISSRDSDDEYCDNYTSDNDDALDGIRYNDRIQTKYLTPASTAAASSTTSDNQKQRPPPPPPPPSKKYHSSARQIEHIDPILGGTTLAMPIPISSQHQQPLPTILATSPSGVDSCCAPSSSSVAAPPPPILPPRPAVVNVNSFDPLPQLPPRPSSSTLARSHTINHSYERGGRMTHPIGSSGDQPTAMQQQPLPTPTSASNLKRAQTMGPAKRTGLTTAPSNLLTKSVYPDFSNATRNPPYIDDHSGERRLVGAQHRGSNQPMAVAGASLATGTHQAKIWSVTTCRMTYGVDLVVGPNDNDRIQSYVFAPPRLPKDEGRYLWAGMQNGSIVAIDASTNQIIGKTSSCHKHPVMFMLRRRNVDVWTLDESGLLAIWPVSKKQQQQQQQDDYHPFDIQPLKHLVTPKAVSALIVGLDLWLSSGRTIHVFCGLGGGGTHNDDKPVRIPNDLGNITQLVTIPFHPGQVFASHDDGRVSVWDSATMEKVQVNAVSLYGICAMATVGDYYLWTGYNTGMIYVYDTRPEKWLVVKTWRAHQGAVVSLLMNDSSFVLNEKTLQVISGDSHGNVAIWDGLMVENWQNQQLQKQAPNYCRYKPARVMLCSWNIDANKPERLVGKDDELVHEWLGAADDPDIIVVGIQEIVDLESKKQTAKSLFATRKKTDTLQEAEETLTHRYRLWHDHLIRVIGDNYGQDTYSVVMTDQLVGLFSCVFVKNSEMHRVWKADSTVVKTGLKVMNKSIHGNKGGIAIRFLFDHSSLCFVNCHLAAGQSHTQDRNANAESILHSANFPEHGQYLDVFCNGGDGSLILDHEHCFLGGDLNYRIAMDRKEVLELLKRKDKVAAWENLQVHDQLKRQNIINPLFKLLWFKEPPLAFDPTYKYDRGTDHYDSSEKKRVPAWCDRILCRSSMAHNIYYRRHEVKASDHRPISAAYDIKVKEIDGLQRDRLLEKIEKDWYHSLEAMVMIKKASYVADYERCTRDQAFKLLQDAHWNVEQVVQNLF